MPTIHILLIDDHPMFRTGLNMVLQSSIPNAQVQEAGSLEEAMRCASQAPDVLLLDIQMEGVNGLAGIHRSNTSGRRHRSSFFPPMRRRTPCNWRWNAEPIFHLQSRQHHGDYRHHRTDAALRAGNPHVRRSAPRRRFPIPADRAPVRSAGFAEPGILQPDNRATTRPVENTVRGHVQSLLVLLRASSRSEAVFEARRQGLLG